MSFGSSCRKCTISYDTFAPSISASFSQLTSRFRLSMVAGGISLYHHLRTDDTPSKRIVGTPTSGGIIGVVGLVVTKLKPPIFQCYLRTTCVKVFFSSAASHSCHEYELILYTLRLLNPLLTTRNSPPAPDVSEDASPLLFSISTAPTINSFGASKIKGPLLLANTADSTINFSRSAATAGRRRRVAR